MKYSINLLVPLLIPQIAAHINAHRPTSKIPVYLTMTEPTGFLLFDEGGVGKAVVIPLLCNNSIHLQTNAYTNSAYTIVYRATSTSNGCYITSSYLGSNSFTAADPGQDIIDCTTQKLNILFYNTSSNCTGPTSEQITALFSDCPWQGVCSTQPLNPVQQSLEFVYTFTDYADQATKKQFITLLNTYDTCPLVPILDVFDTTASFTNIFNYEYNSSLDCYRNAFVPNNSFQFLLDCTTQTGNATFFDSPDCMGNYTFVPSNDCNPITISNDTSIFRGLCVTSASSNHISTPTIIAIAVGSTIFLSVFIWFLRWFLIVRPRFKWYFT